ncbi:MAG TPA: outer membrane beta-barrel protein [Gemmatimonadaceae bacterium]|nr:outer membrane beta-barrel protein [Gemmatimonadaceae bacterium]
MRRRLALVISAVLVSLTTVGAPEALAQSNIRVGGFLGAAMDNDDDWLVFGAEARYRSARMQFEFQPRFQYQSFTGGSMMQLDLNMLFNFRASISQIQPYAGFGGAFNRLSIDEDTPGVDLDDTNVGINILQGLVFGTNPTWRPYAHFEYTMINDFPNQASITLGILFAVSGRMGTTRRAY